MQEREKCELETRWDENVNELLLKASFLEGKWTQPLEALALLVVIRSFGNVLGRYEKMKEIEGKVTYYFTF